MNENGVMYYVRSLLPKRKDLDKLFFGKKFNKNVFLYFNSDTTKCFGNKKIM